MTVTLKTTGSVTADTTTPTVALQTRTPMVVVKELQLHKPYNGTYSWKSFKERFERVVRANN